MLIPKQATLKFEYYEEKGGVRRVTKPAVQNIKQQADFYVDVVRNIQGIGWQSILLINRLSVFQRKTGLQAHKKRRLTFGALRTTMGLAKKEKKADCQQTLMPGGWNQMTLR